MTELMKRLALKHLLNTVFFLIMPLGQTATSAEGPFLSADMRLYFEGPVIESARSAQSIVLVYLPTPTAKARSYDSQHDIIAKTADRLSADIQVVPLTKLAPAPDDHALNWLRAAECDKRPSILPKPNNSALFFSFSGRSGRYCVGISSSGQQSAVLISLLRDLEETRCSYNRDFIRSVLHWLESKSDAQFEGASFETHAALLETLQSSALANCSLWQKG